MKKTCLFCVLVLLCVGCSNSLNDNVNDDLQRLDDALASRPAVESLKRLRIDSLYRVAAVSDNPYAVYRNLYEEYSSYNYDTALLYIRFMEQEATPEQLDEVALCRSFVYISGGLFKDAADILGQWHSTDTALLPDYYFNNVRLLCDLADAVGGELGQQYNAEGLRMNRVLQDYVSPGDTMRYWYIRALTDLRSGNYQRSIERCLKALSATPPSVHYKAIVTSTLASTYRLTGDNERALHYYIEAAVCDILSSTYETVAMRNVAELLFEAGETQLADRYIHLAMYDARRYHARHREVSIAQSLPIIEERMLSRIRTQRLAAIVLLVVVAVLLVIGIIGIVIVRKQNTALHKAHQEIDRMNRSLGEANQLKEELLGTLIASQSQYINAVQGYQQDVRQYAANRQWSELQSIPKAADARQRRTLFDRQIDTILLRIYPTFVQDFNALLRPEDRLTLRKDELLNAQLRIFALIRLGVTHNEVIAEILDYSVNTVYNYKTRVIASSGMAPEAFYDALMRIPSFVR